MRAPHPARNALAPLADGEDASTAQGQRRRQQAQQERQPGRPEAEREAEARAQEATQTPVSGDVAEAEAVMQTGADLADYGERTTAPARRRAPRAPAPPALPRRRRTARRDRGPREETREQKRAAAGASAPRRRSRAAASASATSRRQRPKAEKRRGGVLGFFAWCWTPVKKVQWPDRDTLVQASAVTIIFVAVMAAYLGGLDAAFNWLIKQIL